jgi:hypothetical protein
MPEPVTTPAETLASVRKPASIARAERELALLRQIRDDLGDLANAARRGPGLPPSPYARELAAGQRKNAAGLAAARKSLAAASADYVAACRRALAPRRAAAMEKLRRAYGDLLDAWQELDEIDEAMRSAAPGSTRRRASAAQAKLFYARLIADRLAEEQ